MSLSKKQIQKKAAKNKKRQVALKKTNASLSSRPMLYDVLLNSNIWELGIGTASIALKNNDGNIKIASFKIDVFCLGIKDSYSRTISYQEYAELKGDFEERYGETLESMSASYIKSLISEVVKYSKSIGFAPQGDYKKAIKLLDKIKTPTVIPDFEFGKDGQPFYCSGPYDSMKRSKAIIAKLEQTVGQGNFHYMCALDDDSFSENVLEYST